MAIWVAGCLVASRRSPMPTKKNANHKQIEIEVYAGTPSNSGDFRAVYEQERPEYDYDSSIFKPVIKTYFTIERSNSVI